MSNDHGSEFLGRNIPCSTSIAFGHLSSKNSDDTSSLYSRSVPTKLDDFGTRTPIGTRDRGSSIHATTFTTSSGCGSSIKGTDSDNGSGIESVESSDTLIPKDFTNYFGAMSLMGHEQEGLEYSSIVHTSPIDIYRRPVSIGQLAHPLHDYIGFDNRWNAAMCTYGTPQDTYVDKRAQSHRKSAITAEPRCTWSGQLPQRSHKTPTYSPKVFLGGVPWDITDTGLSEAFQQFGQIRVQWPGREPRMMVGASPKQGYLYVIFESDKRVKELLQVCTHDYSNGGKYYFNISSKRMRSKEVQVIPWIISDSNYVKCPSQRLDPSKTVFVGALHGMLTAEGLAHVANDLFGGVAYVGIDTDKFKYPIGSGRVTFNNQKSYMKAVQAAFVDIKAARFNKKIQIDPYLENSLCSSCNMQPGPIFCRDTACFRYFCRSCWKWIHSTDDLQHHKPIMRNRRD